MAEAVRLYVGTNDGVQVLSVRGGEAELVSEGLGGTIVQAEAGSASSPERVFVAVAHSGLYRTDDAGKRWTKVLDGDMRSVTVDPTDDRVVYAGTDPVHLYRSEDGGDTWQELESLQRLPEETHQRLGETEQVEMSNSHVPTFRHRRQDWWFPVEPHEGHVLQMFIHPDDPNLLLLSIEHGGVARSKDRGQTWEDVSQGIDYLDIHCVTSIPHRFDRYLVASARGLYSTSDPAAGWDRAQNGIERDYFHDIVFMPPRNGGDPLAVVATAEGSPGFWPSTSKSDHWRENTIGSRAALYRSADCGASWQRVGAGNGLDEEMEPFIWALCTNPVENYGLFAGVGRSSGVPSPTRSFKTGEGSVLYSDDAGDSWRPLQTGLSSVERVYAAPE
ncbi:MAG TPA: hypothetical protein VK009_24955 [Chloroflexota bacterium]|nr:hypothetical protein [Chloroflexota bacterium]